MGRRTCDKMDGGSLLGTKKQVNKYVHSILLPMACAKQSFGEVNTYICVYCSITSLLFLSFLSFLSFSLNTALRRMKMKTQQIEYWGLNQGIIHLRMLLERIKQMRNVK